MLTSSTRSFSRASKCVAKTLTAKPSCQIKRSYHENIVDHYENPRNVGSLDKKKSSVGTGLVGAPACGDVLYVRCRLVPFFCSFLL